MKKDEINMQGIILAQGTGKKYRVVQEAD